MWINSLSIDGLYVNDLFADQEDGVCLLRIIDQLQPGMVAFGSKRVTLEPKNRIKKIENTNYAVSLCKELGLSMVNVGGVDICDGNKKLILAVMWQLMRKYTLGVLDSLAAKAGTGAVNEEMIVAWANARVAATGKSHRLRNLKDTSSSSGLFFLALVSAMDSRAVEQENVTPGVTAADKESNAKYAISCARKVGALVFLTFEDIVETKSKMIMTFLSGLWSVDMARN